MTLNNLKPVAVQFKHEDLSSMTVDWYIGKRCNFCCSYCADFLHDNYSKHLTSNQMITFVDRIVDRYGKNITWSITGGEPTVNPKFLDLLKYIKDKRREISVCTNGSRDLKYLKKMFELVETVVVSLHFEHISSNLDEYVEKIIELEKWRLDFNKNIPPEKLGRCVGKTPTKKLIARMMVRPGYEDEVRYVTEKIKSANIEFYEHRIIRPQPKKDVDRVKERTENGNFKFKEKQESKEISKETKVYSPVSNNPEIKESVIKRESTWYNDDGKKLLEEEYNTVKQNRKWLLLYKENEYGNVIKTEEHYNDLNFRGQTNFYGWKCYAGISLIRVAPNGDIFISNCGQGGPIGNIYDNTFNPPTEPVVCQKFRCIDPLDLRQRKYINDDYKDIFNLESPIEK